MFNNSSIFISLNIQYIPQLKCSRISISKIFLVSYYVAVVISSFEILWIVVNAVASSQDLSYLQWPLYGFEFSCDKSDIVLSPRTS